MVWHVPGENALAGDLHGRDAVLVFLRRLQEVNDGTFSLAEHDVPGTDDHVVALSEVSTLQRGMRVRVNVVSVFHYRDGRQIERRFHPIDESAWDAVLGEPFDALTRVVDAIDELVRRPTTRR